MGFGEYGLGEETLSEFRCELIEIRESCHLFPLRVDHVVNKIMPEIITNVILSLYVLRYILELRTAISQIST